MLNLKKIGLDRGLYNYWGTGKDFTPKELDRFAEDMNRLNKKLSRISKKLQKGSSRFTFAYEQDILDTFTTKYENDIFRDGKPKENLQKQFDTLDNFSTQLNKLIAVPASHYLAASKQQKDCFNALHPKHAAKIAKLNPDKHEYNIRYIWLAAKLDKQAILTWFWELPQAKNPAEAKEIVKQANAKDVKDK